jgi:hypothetical protein
MRSFAIALMLVGTVACEKTKSGAEWRATSEPLLIEAFCKPEQYFRVCFDLDEALCRATAAETVKRCFNSTEIPDRIDEPTARQIGARVGECAGGAYDQAMAPKKKNTPKCNDPAAWGEK